MLAVRDTVPLAPLTTFGIGGAAKHLVEVRNEKELREALAWARAQKSKFWILAGGSNVLFPDGGLPGLVTRLVGDDFSNEGRKLTTWAGTNLFALVKAMGERGLGGWEKLAGIPGTVGGAVRGNAGAFGPEIKDFVTKVQALSVKTGEVREFTNTECGFSYRRSCFKENPEWVITRVSLALSPIQRDISNQLVVETIAERERRHLQNVRAAGSYFMNPTAPQEIITLFESEKGVKSREGRVPAGWLIEKVGLKGHRVGDAIASEQHPNYIVNLGNATAHDVVNLAQVVKLEVYNQFGVELHEEAAVL